MTFSKQKNLITTLVAIAIAGGISACSTSSQDDGDGGGNGVSLTGLVVDGYIAYSTVYIDSDEDGKLDVFEARAITDSDGYYSQNMDGSVNYCTLPTDDNRRQHCLNSGTAISENTLLRFAGGYDISTGEKFEGTLTARASADTSEPIIATPLTTLMSHMSADEKLAFATNNGFASASDLEGDFLKNVQSGTPMTADEAKLMQLALQTQKAVDVISNAIEGQNPNVFGEDDNPSDASGTVYEELAKLASSSGGSGLSALLTTPADVETLSSNSGTSAAGYGATTTFTPTERANVAANVNAITTLIDGSLGAGSGLGNVEGLSRTAELATTIIRGTTNDGTSDINPLNTDPVKSAMSAPGVNIDAAKKDIAIITAAADPAAAIQSGYTRTDIFPTAIDLGGKEVSFSRDLGTTVEDSFILYMAQPIDASDVGSLSACGRYMSPGIGNTNYTTGIKLDGTWERLDDFTLLLSIGVDDSREQVTVSALSLVGNIWTLGFDYQDQQDTWTSSADTFTTTTMDPPADDAACSEKLGTPNT